jgi:hypothetical protein
MAEPRTRFVRAVQPSVGQLAGGGGGEQRSRRNTEPLSRIVKVGEVLAHDYDLSAVDEEDRSSVQATIACVATLEQSVPQLDITVNRDSGYYAIVVRGFNEYIDLHNWHERVRVKSASSKMRLVRNFLCNPKTGTLVVRVGMHQSGAPLVAAGALPVLMPLSRKRGGAATDDAPVHDFALARRIMDELAQRCDMDAVQPADRHRLLTLLYHVTLLDASHPLLDIRPVQRDTDGYVMTCTGFPNLVDFDEWHQALLGNAHNDDSLRSLRSVSYNPAQGVLQLCIEGPKGRSYAASAGKKRRALQGDGDDEDDQDDADADHGVRARR